MTTLRARLDAARAAAEGVAPPAPLDLARAVLDEPLRVLVVGRRGTGKTSLVNAWTGTSRPTGLGGVTREVVTVAAACVAFTDTPGFDSVDDAVITASALAERAEVVVFATDGLQPWTSTERAVWDHLRAPDLYAVRVISRLDLVDDTDRAEVVDRLQALTPMETWWADLRRASRGGAAPPVPTLPDGGPRRRARIRALLADLVVPTVPEAADVRGWFRARARDAVDAIAVRVGAGELRGAAAIRAAFGEAFEAVVAELAPAAGDLPPLPAPRDPDRPDRRGVVAAGADWIAQVEVALDEGYGHAAAGRRGAVLAFRRAMDAVRDAL